MDSENIWWRKKINRHIKCAIHTAVYKWYRWFFKVLLPYVKLHVSLLNLCYLNSAIGKCHYSLKHPENHRHNTTQPKSARHFVSMAVFTILFCYSWRNQLSFFSASCSGHRRYNIGRALVVLLWVIFTDLI